MFRMKPLGVLRIVVMAGATWLWVASLRLVADNWRQFASDGVHAQLALSGDALTPEQEWVVAHQPEVELGIWAVGGLMTLGQVARALRDGRGGRSRGRAGGDGLDAPLIHWSQSDAWTERDSYAGTFICGANGSGKTTGSGRAIAKAFLRAGYGGLVLTAKSEETDLWRRYCRETGREGDLVVFGADEPWRFDAIDFELRRTGAGAGQTESIVQLISTLLEMAERNGAQGGGREDEGYWRRASRQMCRNLVDLLSLAQGRVSIPELYRLVVSAPHSLEQMRSPEWRSTSFCFKCLVDADRRPKSDRQRRDLELVADYFLGEFPSLSEKTRSVVVSTFTSMIDVLNRGLLRELLCSGTNITPKAIEEGKIIVIDLPVKEYAEVGQYAQVVWKYAFQRSIERRDVRTSPRPVFLWADEAQFFVTAGDAQFVTTCRGFRAATVYLTQNVNNLYAALGGVQQGKAQADGLLGCFNSKLFHANSDAVSNEMAANMIGRTRQYFVNANSGQQGDWIAGAFGLGDAQQGSAGVSEAMEYEIQPAEFASLRTGGPENAFQVDAILFQTGKSFADTGRTWRFVTFNQRA